MNVGADRNYLKTVELSSGGYCWLFGSDDLMKPGSIDLILSEIITKCDVYLCGFTLCTYKMGPIAEHLIFESTRDKVYELDDDISRHNYFKHAKTSTAFFSFLGSLIVNKKKWDMVEIDEKKFIGSLWVHVAKIFGMIPFGLKVKYISKPLLLKRGENDSFLEKGIANRIGVSVYGYKMIGDYFFFNNSLETSNIQRVIKFEWPLSAFVSYKTVSLNEKKYVINYCSNYFDNFNENKFKIFLDEYIY